MLKPTRRPIDGLHVYMYIHVYDVYLSNTKCCREKTFCLKGDFIYELMYTMVYIYEGLFL